VGDRLALPRRELEDGMAVGNVKPFSEYRFGGLLYDISEREKSNLDPEVVSVTFRTMIGLKGTLNVRLFMSAPFPKCSHLFCRS
jgi:hypothetical protein